MNAEEFYQLYKAAIEFFGLGWAEKQKATMWIDGKLIYLEYAGLRCAIELKPNKQEGK
jgi:hypothetical protein